MYCLTTNKRLMRKTLLTLENSIISLIYLELCYKYTRVLFKYIVNSYKHRAIKRQSISEIFLDIETLL